MRNHELPDLPYPKDALEPHVSAETLDYHHGKHHASYVDSLNEMIEGTEYQSASLEEIIEKASGDLFNNAAQVWNHNFYWHCMSPDGGGEPDGALAGAIADQFGVTVEALAAANGIDNPDLIQPGETLTIPAP